MLQLILAHLRREEGATMVEYGLMLALIAAVCIATVIILGGNTNTTFQNVAGQMPGPNP